MYGWEPRVLLRHYLEQGLSKTAIAARVGLSRRTLYRWLAQGKLDGDLDATTVRYPARRTKLDPYKPLIEERLTTYPELTAVRLFDEVQAAGYAGRLTRRPRGRSSAPCATCAKASSTAAASPATPISMPKPSSGSTRWRIGASTRPPARRPGPASSATSARSCGPSRRGPTSRSCSCPTRPRRWRGRPCPGSPWSGDHWPHTRPSRAATDEGDALAARSDPQSARRPPHARRLGGPRRHPRPGRWRPARARRSDRSAPRGADHAAQYPPARRRHALLASAGREDARRLRLQLPAVDQTRAARQPAHARLRRAQRKRHLPRAARCGEDPPRDP